MNKHRTPANRSVRFGRYLSLGLATTLAIPIGLAQDADSLRRLQDENAALRKRLAEIEGRAAPAPATTAPAARTPAAPAAARPAPAPAAGSATTVNDEGITVLSPFQVNDDKDYGYLKTNSATATRIGMEIQKVPLNISVLSREFLDDTNAKSLTDLFRYSAAASGDTRFAMRVPANEATPQGGFTMRGFSVNTLMRDGIFRYTAYSLDNTERVEVVKGPASVFFGQGYPGGVINYVTKRASFAKVPTSFTYAIDDNGGDKFKYDHNVVLSKKTAFRVVGAWEDTVGERRFEFKKGFNVTPSLTVVPFDSGKVRVNVDFEYLKERFNYNDYDWIYSDFAGWQSAARTGQYGTSTATLSNTIAIPGGTPVVQATTTPTVAYATYINNKRVATGDLTLPAYTKVKRGGYYIDRNNRTIYDEAFNYTSRGSWSDNEVKVMTAAVEFAPYDWLSGRAAWVRDVSNFNNFGNSAVTTPYADGVHWNVGLSAGGSGYYRETKTSLIDLVFKKDLWGTKNKLLTGFQKSDWRQLYLGKAAASDANLAFLPGARNATANPDYAVNPKVYDFGGVPVNQVIRQRDGSVKPVRQIYSNWDPGAEISPDISVYWQDDRNALDGYRPSLQSHYINYQGSFFKDRLTVLAGYREEKRWERWQDQSNNFPWYVYTSDMITNPTAYPEDVWGHSKAYQQTIPLDQKGRSAMGGLSYSVTKSINVYASASKLFKFNSGNVGGFFPGPGVGDELSVYQSALNYGFQGLNPQGQPILQPGSFIYQGQRITSVAQAKQVMQAKGAYDQIKNESGSNIEFGAKISTPDNKIVGTISFFRGERSNQKLDDGAHQSNLEEPFNFSTTLFAPGSVGYNARNFRWRTTDLKNRIEGSEAEVIWTPRRNLQAVINGSWLWTAKTVYDKTRAMPGSTAYNASSAAAKIASNIYYTARLENVPEYRLNFFGKYTLTEDLIGNYGRGVSLGGGMRYSSKTVVSRSVDWNPLAGGYHAGNYLVFDLTVGYPWEVLGYRLTSTLGVYNVTDEKYSEGSFAMSPARNWLFTTAVKF
ncbi:MAG: TonB-dependent receptor plug domain-containing protein [Verrucomicrobia bacterium]|nr:TonB-dependent receptor plug domain-containing protein [Verrucomicrobiota bacterium]